MNKLKKFYHNFHDLPAFIVAIILAVAMIAFFGYVFFLMDSAQPEDQNSPFDNQDMAKQTEAVEQDKEEKNMDMSEESLEEPEDKMAVKEGGLEVMANTSFTDFEVWNNGVRAGEIKREAVSQVNIFKKIGSNVYLGAGNKSAAGSGYILFNGPQAIYKLEAEKNSLIKIFDKEVFVSDISPDEKKLVAVESFYVGDDIRNYLDIYDLGTYQPQSYQVPETYTAAGNAFFSKDGKKLAYEAAVGNPRNETFAMFVINLETGEQTQISDENSHNKAKAWAGSN